MGRPMRRGFTDRINNPGDTAPRASFLLENSLLHSANMDANYEDVTNSSIAELSEMLLKSFLLHSTTVDANYMRMWQILDSWTVGYALNLTSIGVCPGACLRLYCRSRSNFFKKEEIVGLLPTCGANVGGDDSRSDQSVQMEESPCLPQPNLEKRRRFHAKNEMWYSVIARKHSIYHWGRVYPSSAEGVCFLSLPC